VGATPDCGAASRTGERLRAHSKWLSQDWGITRSTGLSSLSRIGLSIAGLYLTINFVKHWFGTQSPAWPRLVPYDDEVEVLHELGGRLARTFGSFDKHG
jgi:hypothetical protein